MNELRKVILFLIAIILIGIVAIFVLLLDRHSRSDIGYNAPEVTYDMSKEIK